MARRAETRHRMTGSEADSEWGIERLDLDAYLKRLSYEGSLDPMVETLQALHRAHLASIPFENLDILLGRGISLELDAIQQKLVQSQRGGYCFEHNLLFSAALERIGFSVTRLSARVQPDRPGPRTHVCLVVEAGGERWLADTGFGTTLLEAAPLRDGAISEQGVWTYRLDLDESGVWYLRSMTQEGWATEYAFSLEPQRQIDYIVHNHYTSTYPGSPFVNQLVALRKTPERQYALRGREFTTSVPGQAYTHRTVGDDDLAGVLEETFGIALSTAEVAKLIGS
jgi:N-hydroxyarylamine O-acetyltransferase